MRKSHKPTPESLVLRSCIQWLYHKKIIAWRHNTGSYSTDDGRYIQYGLPGSADIIGLLPSWCGEYAGKFLAVECKSGTNELTKAQEVFRDKIRRSGGIYILARSTDDLEKGLALYLTSRPF